MSRRTLPGSRTDPWEKGVGLWNLFQDTQQVCGNMLEYVEVHSNEEVSSETNRSWDQQHLASYIVQVKQNGQCYNWPPVAAHCSLFVCS